VSNEALMHELADDASRPDPYPIYARFRASPVTKLDDGSYAVSTYHEIAALLHDPRLSSDPANLPSRPPDAGAGARAFIRMDPPEHDRLRRVVMRYFGPPATPDTVVNVEPEIRSVAGRLIDDLGAGGRVDIVDQFAYPLPVTIICQLFGVPLEDEAEFRGAADKLTASLGAADRIEGAEQILEDRQNAQLALGAYLLRLVQRHRDHPNDSMLSRMACETGDTRLEDLDLAATGVLLFVAGHETTVNLISNGMLTLLRHPAALQRLRDEPELAPSLVEELLRFEPPVQYIPNRSTLADVEIGGTTIPKGSHVNLLLASGNRDPLQFDEPERFIPDRRDNQHFGYGGGIHYCFGAPLARLETQIALVELARRLRNPRLVDDPPPYRPSSVLRGPIQLLVDFDGLDP
jgi:cytochrome P450